MLITVTATIISIPAWNGASSPDKDAGAGEGHQSLLPYVASFGLTCTSATCPFPTITLMHTSAHQGVTQQNHGPTPVSEGSGHTRGNLSATHPPQAEM
jgi:hypothetical protein